MFDIDSFKKLLANDHARRELLWLRAREKGDDQTARDLERADPGIVDRLRADGFDVDGPSRATERERRERWQSLYDARCKHYGGL